MMLSVRSTLLHIVVVLLCLEKVSATVLPCYNPDGTIDAGGRPCNQTLSESACCSPGDACTNNGLCLGTIGIPYRGGCTDPLWSSTACSSQCITNLETNKKYGGITNLYRCGATAGTLQMSVCCALSQQSSTDTCCGNTFTYSTAQFSFQTGTDAQLAAAGSNANSNSELEAETETQAQTTTVTTSVATATVTATVTLTAAASSSLSAAGASSSDTTICATNSTSNLGLPIGVGVGVPFGALCFGLLAFLFYRENKKRPTLDYGDKNSSSLTSMRSNISFRNSRSDVGALSMDAGMGRTPLSPRKSQRSQSPERHEMSSYQERQLGEAGDTEVVERQKFALGPRYELPTPNNRGGIRIWSNI